VRCVADMRPLDPPAIMKPADRFLLYPHIPVKDELRFIIKKIFSLKNRPILKRNPDSVPYIV
jgi:hypothetical protein